MSELSVPEEVRHVLSGTTEADDVEAYEMLAEQPGVMARIRDRVAIVGFASNTRDQAPYSHEDWDVWCCNQYWQGHEKRRWTAWFDLHPRDVVNNEYWHKGHVKWLRKQTQPVYMLEQYDDIPASVALPRQALIDHFGRYFTSTIAWMIGLAIYQGYGHIGVYGVDMLGETEYADQRPCCEFLLGWARGAGITLDIPPECALLKAQYLYGYEYRPPLGGFALTKVQGRKQQLIEKKDQVLAALHRIDGALYEAKGFQEHQPDSKALAERIAKMEEQHLTQQKLLYGIDGAVQEVHYWETMAKHMGRGGA